MVTRSALPLIGVLVLWASRWQMGLLSAAGSAQVPLIGLLVGAWADRLRRRPILIATDLGRAALVLSIPVAAMLGWLTLTYLYVVAALAGGLTVFFDVAYQAFLPTLVAPEQLIEGNSKLSLTGSLAWIRAREPPPASSGPRASVMPEIGEGVRLTWGQPSLRAPTLAMARRDFFGSFYGALYGL